MSRPKEREELTNHVKKVFIKIYSNKINSCQDELMRIILIGNYKPDKQESMIRFAKMLQAGFIKTGVKTEIWWPSVVLGGFAKSTNAGMGKWVGYVDKWIFFPVILRWKVLQSGKQNVNFHVCDHSNAPYLKHLPKENTGITCHDVIAIRGGLGYADAYCDASITGKILQRWILKNLSKARLLAAVSERTLVQLKELTTKENNVNKSWRVINNAFNAAFAQIAVQRAKKLVVSTGLDLKVPFILHVGSGVPRKNRRMLLNMFHLLKDEWSGNICFAGESPDKDLLDLAKSLQLEEKIFVIIKPDHDTLVALYNTCDAFIFPSFSEGFGWPLIEAQACGAPVIASNIEPMPEISGGAALYSDPANPAEFAQAFLSLRNNSKRAEIIEKGLLNAQRFSSEKMINAYLDLYKIKPLAKNYVAESY